MKTCTKCDLSLPETTFSKQPGGKNGLQAHCKKCRYVVIRQYKTRLRESVFDLLGRECQKCSFSNVLALQLDHINGGGGKERRKISQVGVLLRALQYPEEYQILCANCNWIKRMTNGEK